MGPAVYPVGASRKFVPLHHPRNHKLPGRVGRAVDGSSRRFVASHSQVGDHPCFGSRKRRRRWLAAGKNPTERCCSCSSFHLCRTRPLLSRPCEGHEKAPRTPLLRMRPRYTPSDGGRTESRHQGAQRPIRYRCRPNLRTGTAPDNKDLEHLGRLPQADPVLRGLPSSAEAKVRELALASAFSAAAQLLSLAIRAC